MKRKLTICDIGTVVSWIDELRYDYNHDNACNIKQLLVSILFFLILIIVTKLLNAQNHGFTCSDIKSWQWCACITSNRGRRRRGGVDIDVMVKAQV